MALQEELFNKITFSYFSIYDYSENVGIIHNLFFKHLNVYIYWK